jgi:hypothetical protein
MRLVSNGGFYFLDVQSSAVWDVEEQNNFLISQGIDPTTDTGFDLMSELKNTQITWERPVERNGRLRDGCEGPITFGVNDCCMVTADVILAGRRT